MIAHEAAEERSWRELCNSAVVSFDPRCSGPPPQHAGAARLGCFKTILESDKVGSGPVHYWSCIEMRTSAPVCTPRTKGTLQCCSGDPHPTVPLWAVCSGRTPSVDKRPHAEVLPRSGTPFDVPWVCAYTPTYWHDDDGGVVVLPPGDQSCADALLPKAR